MSGAAWDQLESLAVKSVTKIGHSKPINVEEKGNPQQTPRNQNVNTGNQGRSTEGERTPKRRKKSRETQDPPRDEDSLLLSLEGLGEGDYERFKKEPMEMCVVLCRADNRVMKQLKVDEATLESTKKKLEKALNSKAAAVEAKNQAEDDKAKAVKRNKELMAQVKDLKDQIAGLEDDKTTLNDRVHEVAGVAKDAAVYQFQNAIDQMRVLNADWNVEVDYQVLKPEHCVEGDEIVLPLKKDGEGKITQQRSVVFGRT